MNEDEELVHILENLENNVNTEKTSEHKASGFSYVRIAMDPKYEKPPVRFTGEDCAEKFLELLENDLQEIRDILSQVVPMNLTPQEKANFKSARSCHICERPFYPGQKKVRDHCHITGTCFLLPFRLF